MITIERVTAEDVPEVKHLLRETWADTYSGILSPQTIQTVTTAWHAPPLLAQQAQNPICSLLWLKMKTASTSA